MQLDFDRIKRLRTDKGWTQQQLADICSISLRTVQRVELHGIASMETSTALASAFELLHTELLQTETGDEPTVTNKLHALWLLLAFIAGGLCGAGLLSLLR